MKPRVERPQQDCSCTCMFLNHSISWGHSQLTLSLVRSSCSLCPPSSSIMSLPICSVSLATRWLLSILWLALLSDSVPCSSRALWDCWYVWTGQTEKHYRIGLRCKRPVHKNTLKKKPSTRYDDPQTGLTACQRHTHTLLVLCWIKAVVTPFCCNIRKARSRTFHVSLQFGQIPAEHTELRVHCVSVEERRG